MPNKKEIKVTNFSDENIKQILDFVKDIIKSDLWEVIYNKVYYYNGNTQEFYDRLSIRYNKHIICYMWKNVTLTREILFEFLIEAKIIKIKCQLKKKY